MASSADDRPAPGDPAPRDSAAVEGVRPRGTRWWRTAGRPRQAIAVGSVGAALVASVLTAASWRSAPAGPQPLWEGLPPAAAAPARGATCAPGAADPVLPAAGTPFAAMAARSRADLLALSGSFPLVPGNRPASAGTCGAAVAAWRPSWRYVWPRDASFTVAALSVTGDRARAAAVLDFLAGIAPADGRWAARYLPDGSGRTPDDDRPFQADGGGWTCWAVWAAVTYGPHPAGAAAAARWWPMVTSSADAMAASVERTGLPAVSPDYWEVDTDRPTLELLAATVVGLRSAADLAARSGHPDQAARWAAAARTATAALAQRWGTRGYPRTLPRGGADAAVGLLGAFVPDLPGVPPAVRSARRELLLPNGGVRPGADWHHDDGMAWTPEEAMLALGAARSDPAAARRSLAWLDAHRTRSGALPEKVAPDGSPAAVAPLAWTGALVLLTVAELSAPLPSLPAG